MEYKITKRGESAQTQNPHAQSILEFMKNNAVVNDDELELQLGLQGVSGLMGKLERAGFVEKLKETKFM